MSANQRMFNREIVLDDKFLIETSHKAQALYYAINMESDDDGICNSFKGIMRKLAVDNTVLQELIDNGYLMQIESYVIVLDWRIHNSSFRKHRPTIHTQIKDCFVNNGLSEPLESGKRYVLKEQKKENKSSEKALSTSTYTSTSTSAYTSTSTSTYAQSRLDKNRLDKSSVGRYPENENQTPDASIVTYQSPIKTQKEKHGNHVLLTPMEYDMLIEKYGKEETQERIAFLDKVIQRKPESYERIKDKHFEQLQERWIDNGIQEERAKRKRSSDAKDQKPSIPDYKQRDYDFDELRERLMDIGTPKDKEV